MRATWIGATDTSFLEKTRIARKARSYRAS